jgi:integrase
LSSEAEALREQVRRLQSQLDELKVEPATQTSLAELVEHYLGDLEARTTGRHSTQVRRQLGMVLAALPVTTVEELRPRHLLAYRNAQLNAGRSNRCANVHLQAIKGALTWAHSMQEIDVNPIAGVKPLPTGERHATQHRRALSEDEVVAFLTALDEEDRAMAARSGYRVPQTPFFRALLETGARYGEMITATWADLDLTPGKASITLRARNTKAGRKRAIPLTRPMVAALNELPAYHELLHGQAPRPNDRIFLTPTGKPWCIATNSVRRILNRMLAAAGIPQTNDRGEKVDIHALRHCAITRFARAGVPLAQVQAIAGHSDPKLTARVYMHLQTEDLRSAVDCLEPKPRPQSEPQPKPQPPTPILERGRDREAV